LILISLFIIWYSNRVIAIVVDAADSKFFVNKGVQS
jgi:hypothetical protein